MTGYRRGYDRERDTADLLEQDGYVVWRCGGSKGPGSVDLLAAKPGQWLLIQVKSGTAELEHGWWNDLYHHARWLGAHAIVADWPLPPAKVRGAKLRLRRITGPHVQRSQHWPQEPFYLDEVERAAAALDAAAARHPAGKQLGRGSDAIRLR